MPRGEAEEGEESWRGKRHATGDTMEYKLQLFPFRLYSVFNLVYFDLIFAGEDAVLLSFKQAFYPLYPLPRTPSG